MKTIAAISGTILVSSVVGCGAWDCGRTAGEVSAYGPAFLSGRNTGRHEMVDKLYQQVEIAEGKCGQYPINVCSDAGCKSFYISCHKYGP